MDEGTSGAGEALVAWASASDFWAMGGYGFYVWGSYGATIAVIAIELWLLRSRRRNSISALKQETTRASV